MEKLKSSIAKPWSLPGAFKTRQRIQRVPPMLRVVLTVPPKLVTLFAARLPSSAPAVPLVWGLVKLNVPPGAVQVATPPNVAPTPPFQLEVLGIGVGISPLLACITNREGVDCGRSIDRKCHRHPTCRSSASGVAPVSATRANGSKGAFVGSYTAEAVE